jgi:two-component system cell cycle sensor histidine kinase/response regulator CckA
LGYVAASVAHDFNNLLTPIVANAAVLGEMLPATSRESQMAAEILMAAERAAVLVRQMLTLAKPRRSEAKCIDVHRAIADMMWLIRRVVRDGVEVAIEMGAGEGPLEVLVDGNKLEHAILNLVANARDAMPRGGRLTITTSVVALGQEPSGCTAQTTEYVAITVADTGVGMTPQVRERIFETFFTTKEEGLGTGLGFASVRRFVEASGGCMAVHSDVGRGTSVVLYLPRARSSAARTFSEEPILL